MGASDVEWNRVVVDLDGTICHSYWPNGTEADIPNLEPIPGSLQAMRTLYRLLHPKGIRLVIWTARPSSMREQTEAWLKRYGVPYDELWMDKPPYLVVIDDRALNFDGSWEGTLGRAVAYRPWWMIGDRPQTFEEALDLTLQKQRVVMSERQRKYGPRNMMEAGLLGAINRARQDKINRILRVYEREHLRKLCWQEGMPQEVIDRWFPSLRADYLDESLEDAHVDAANYLGPICIMLLRDWWGLPMAEAEAAREDASASA